MMKTIMIKTLNNNPKMIKNYTSIFEEGVVKKFIKSFDTKGFNNNDSQKAFFELKANIAD